MTYEANHMSKDTTSAVAQGIDTVEAPPVTDWVNDWDWLDDSWGENAIDIWNSVREQCPVAMTERYGRAFMPVTMEAVSAIANDTVNFSSIFVSVAQPDAIRRPAPPITSDPPDHHGHRRLLLPSFSPKRIAQMEPELRDYTRSLIDAIQKAKPATAKGRYVQSVYLSSTMGPGIQVDLTSLDVK